MLGIVEEGGEEEGGRLESYSSLARARDTQFPRGALGGQIMSNTARIGNRPHYSHY